MADSPIENTLKLLEELRGDASQIIIWRNGELLDKVRPEEVGDDLAFWLKETYGGGKYIIMVQGKDGKIKKRVSLSIDGTPKLPPSEISVQDGTISLLKELIKELREKDKKSSYEQNSLMQMLLQMQQQQFSMMLELMKANIPTKREKSAIEKALEKLLSNPQILLTVGGGAWKVLRKALNSKDELLELLKIAKDDPEIKEMAVSILGAKYGTGGSLLDKILGDPSLLGKTLEIIDKALSARTVGQKPADILKTELRELAGAPYNREAQNSIKSSQTFPIVSSSPVGSSRLMPNPTVEPQEEEIITVQEIIALGTKILEQAEKGLTAEKILNLLTEEEVAILQELTENYNIRTAEDLIKLLETLPLPKFTIKGYIEAIQNHSLTLNNLLSSLRESTSEKLVEEKTTG